MAPARTCECGECQKCKHREYMRAYYRTHADKARTSAIRSRNRRLEAVQAYDRARGFRETDPVKIKARNATRILRTEPHSCVECGAPRAHAHHPDYSKPLNVVWLCRTCHSVAHRTF
jgi:hypothetical protein